MYSKFQFHRLKPHLSLQYILEAKLSFQHLKQQQAGLEQLIGVIKDDIEDLKLIEQGLQDPAQRR